jgi:zinc transporter, ZIP family
LVIAWFVQLSPVWQALLATCFTWFLTALGAASVFLAGGFKEKWLNGALGFAVGIMLAASYWSLLAPAIQLTIGSGVAEWLPATVGFLLGGAFLWGVDRLLPHVHLGVATEDAEGISAMWRRSTLLILAVTLHNIPEGLAVGVAFGAVAYGIPSATLASAAALALGIGIQNMPEGMAIALPLRREGMSRRSSFTYGQLSGIVEPFAGVLGAVAVVLARPILPYAMAFAAGAMFYVIVEELIPESQLSGTNLPTIAAMIGFVIMMILEVST